MSNNKMRVEIKKMWLDALRSGEYKQGQLALRTEDSFCCLGVLCDLHRKNSDDKLEWEVGETGYDRFLYYDHYTSLPKLVMNWAFLIPSKFAKNEILVKIAKLANCNDSGSDFQEIANIIESEL